MATPLPPPGVTDPRQLLRGPLAEYAACLRLPGDAVGHEFALSELQHAAGIARVLAGYRAAQPPAPARALVSQWFKRYLLCLLVPQAGLLWLGGWQLPAAPQALALSADGEVLALRYAAPGAPLAASTAAARWQPLLHGHLAPLIAALARYAAISPRVLWNSAGNLLETMLQSLAAQASPTQAADRVLLLDDARWPWPAAEGTRNPMRSPVRYLPPLLPEVLAQATRLRRLCCQRYEIPGQVYCATCPHLTRLSRDELLELLPRWQHQH